VISNDRICRLIATDREALLEMLVAYNQEDAQAWRDLDARALFDDAQRIGGGRRLNAYDLNRWVIDTLPPATLEQLAGRLTRLASRLRRELDLRQPDPTARLWREL